jgi:hypothetical protein
MKDARAINYCVCSPSHSIFTNDGSKVFSVSIYSFIPCSYSNSCKGGARYLFLWSFRTIIWDFFNAEYKKGATLAVDFQFLI